MKLKKYTFLVFAFSFSFSTSISENGDRLYAAEILKQELFIGKFQEVAVANSPEDNSPMK